MSGLEKSPLVRLVLFMFCLAIAGSIIAGVHYYAVDLPRQDSLHPPVNTLCHTELCRFCNACWNVCMAKTTFEWNACFDECDTHGCHFNDD
jgi:hypothetical protein